ncbi:MAG: heavy metal-responsive transcriptional regulator [Deltaproteobacteria bacterium]|nr:heavy metal-responsive transcriptional regulator [Deltaproteobacteria bacterium]
MDRLFTIGTLARRVGVNIQTIRYYERRGLLQPSKRVRAGITGIGYRMYDEDAVRRLKFILHAKELGFTLKETEGLLDLKVDKTARCGDIKKKAEEKLMEIDKKIQGLEGIQRILKDLVNLCKSKQSTDRCPILKAIDEKEG